MSIEDPHFSMAQSGASRSVSPETEQMGPRFLEARKRGAESWYLSGKRVDGSVR